MVDINRIFTIDIFRPTAMTPAAAVFNQGFLKFQHGNIRVHTPCWWRKKRIVPGIYVATATRMGERTAKDGSRPPFRGAPKPWKREGIWLKRKTEFPRLFSVVDPGMDRPLPIVHDEDAKTAFEKTATEVFIHKYPLRFVGREPDASDACFVAAEEEVLQIWDAIAAAAVNEENALVYVNDFAPIVHSGSIPTM